MASRRTTPLPPDWHKRKQAVFARDGYRCTWIRSDGKRCYNETELECDHIGDNEDHELENLRTLCKQHHMSRSGLQGAEMSVLSRKRRFERAKRHPGVRFE